jgi:hypothetical protein
MADPIARAIGTFATLKGMEYQKEDRIFKRDMLERQDTRAAAAETRAQEEFDINKGRTASADAWLEEERERKKETWSQEDYDRDQLQITELVNGAYQAAGDDASQFDLAGLANSLTQYHERGTLPDQFAYLVDPNALKRDMAAVEDLVGPAREGKLPDHDKAVNAFNVLYGPALNQRGQKYGAKQVRIARIVPTEQGDGVYFEGEITKADGTTYRAPLTMNGGTAEEGDDVARPYTMKEIYDSLAARTEGHKKAKGFLLAKGKIEARKPEYVFGGDGALTMDKTTGKVSRTEYVKPGKGGSGSGSGTGSGGRGGADLKPHVYDEFNDALLGSMVAEYGINDGDFATDMMGNQKVDPIRYLNALPPEARERYLLAKSQGERLMAGGLSPIQAAQQALGPAAQVRVADPAILQKAEEIARKEANNKAGWFSSDEADFKDSGGTKEGFIAERKQYWARKLAAQGNGSPQGEAPQGEAQNSYAALDAGDKQSVEKVAQYLATLPPEKQQAEILEIRQNNPELVAALRDQRQGAARRSAGGMTAPASLLGPPDSAPKWAGSPTGVMNQMQTTLNASKSPALTRAQEAPLKLLWQVNPMRLAAVGVTQQLKAFQHWAQNRYPRQPNAVQNPEVLAEYAKVDPKAAKQIQKAAERLAQEG